MGEIQQEEDIGLPVVEERIGDTWRLPLPSGPTWMPHYSSGQDPRRKPSRHQRSQHEQKKRKPAL
jgi:hypothetical protein